MSLKDYPFKKVDRFTTKGPLHEVKASSSSEKSLKSQQFSIFHIPFYFFPFSEGKNFMTSWHKIVGKKEFLMNEKSCHLKQVITHTRKKVITCSFQKNVCICTITQKEHRKHTYYKAFSFKLGSLRYSLYNIQENLLIKKSSKGFRKLRILSRVYSSSKKPIWLTPTGTRHQCH